MKAAKSRKDKKECHLNSNKKRWMAVICKCRYYGLKEALEYLVKAT